MADSQPERVRCFGPGAYSPLGSPLGSPLDCALGPRLSLPGPLELGHRLTCPTAHRFQDGDPVLRALLKFGGKPIPSATTEAALDQHSEPLATLPASYPDRPALLICLGPCPGLQVCPMCSGVALVVSLRAAIDVDVFCSDQLHSGYGISHIARNVLA